MKIRSRFAKMSQKSDSDHTLWSTSFAGIKRMARTSTPPPETSGYIHVDCKRLREWSESTKGGGITVFLLRNTVYPTSPKFPSFYHSGSWGHSDGTLRYMYTHSTSTLHKTYRLLYPLHMNGVAIIRVSVVPQPQNNS